jgi:hypothetical protein
MRTAQHADNGVPVPSPTDMVCRSVVLYLKRPERCSDASTTNSLRDRPSAAKSAEA